MKSFKKLLLAITAAAICISTATMAATEIPTTSCTDQTKGQGTKAFGDCMQQHAVQMECPYSDSCESLKEATEPQVNSVGIATTCAMQASPMGCKLHNDQTKEFCNTDLTKWKANGFACS